MTWDPIWDNIFETREKWGKYPPEDFVRFFVTQYSDHLNKKEFRILEIGCGPGAGIAFYAATESITYFGIDGSLNAIKQAQQKYLDFENLMNFTCSQASNLDFPDSYFDLVVDIACLQHNTSDEVILILNEVYRVLKTGGSIYSQQISNFTDHDKSAIKIDGNTFKDQNKGLYSGMGTTRVTNLRQINKDFGKFNKLVIDTDKRTRNNGDMIIESYIVKGTKQDE